VHGAAKLARRVFLPARPGVVLEMMDEPKRLHHQQQTGQEKSDGTATLEHGIETEA
jgi:hypothetical protein